MKETRASELFTLGKRHLDSATLLLGEVNTHCAFHLQQSLEMAFKGQIEDSGKYKMYNNKHRCVDTYPFGHNLRELYYTIKNYRINIINDSALFTNNNLDIITSWESKSRYNVTFTPDINVLNIVIEHLTEYYKKLEEKYGEFTIEKWDYEIENEDIEINLD